MEIIDCKSLMIGDWVMLTDPINNGEKVQVKEIHGDGYIAVDGGLTAHVEPIPLSSEILEKNGFVKSYGVSDTPPYDKDEEGNMYIVIKYVHELQHALRLAGINKEITI